MRDIADEIAAEFKLTPSELEQMLPSGKQTTFLNRLHWAKSYMQKAGIIESERRGYFRVSDQGRSILKKAPHRIDMNYLENFESYRDWKSQERKGDDNDKAVDAEQHLLDPEEVIARSYDRITGNLASEIRQNLQNVKPSFFEKIIIDLLLAMGYGGGRSEMARALGKSGDGGVDGVINEDVLGLDVVYVQAKRYAPDTAVPTREVRDFVGSLEGHRASKGIFVTTSSFPSSAHDYVGRVSKRVILIDGKELARLMIKHNVGVRQKDTYEIKKIDEDYFLE